MQDQSLFPLKRKTRLQMYVLTARRVAYTILYASKFEQLLSSCVLYFTIIEHRLQEIFNHFLLTSLQVKDCSIGEFWAPFKN